MFILSVLLLIVNFWASYHLSAKSIWFLIANGPIALIAIIGGLSKIFSKEEVSRGIYILRGSLFFLLNTPVLIILSGLMLFFGSIVSSVTVMSSGVRDPMNVGLTPEGHSDSKQIGEKLGGPNDVVAFIKTTTPFGRPFYLEVKGYLRYSFDLYPWIGKKIRVASDLTISPSILIRVPTEAQMFLPNGKIVVIYDDTLIAQRNTMSKRGSILVGHDVSIPNELIGQWKTELIAENIPAPTAARSLLAWQHFQVAPPLVALVPGKTAEAKFLIQGKIVKARAKFKIGTKKIQDVLMIKEVEP